MEDLYTILDVEKDASTEDIKKAYRKKAKTVHPDIDPSTSEEFIKINFAYKILTDDVKRLDYDRSGKVEKETDINEAVLILINNLLVSIIESEVDLAEVDVQELLIDTIEKTIKDTFNTILEMEKKIKYSDKLILKFGKVKNPKKSNLVPSLIKKIQTIIKSELKKAKELVEIHKAAITLIKNYEYEMDKKEDEEVTDFYTFLSQRRKGTWIGLQGSPCPPKKTSD